MISHKYSVSLVAPLPWLSLFDSLVWEVPPCRMWVVILLLLSMFSTFFDWNSRWLQWWLWLSMMVDMLVQCNSVQIPGEHQDAHFDSAKQLVVCLHHLKPEKSRLHHVAWYALWLYLTFNSPYQWWNVNPLSQKQASLLPAKKKYKTEN